MLTITQDKENRVFEELKSALIESSMSHKIRPESFKLKDIDTLTAQMSTATIGQ